MMKLENILVLIADDSFDEFAGVSNGKPENYRFHDRVRVSDSHDIKSLLLGFASLHWEGEKLLADLEIMSDEPVAGKYPSIAGVIHKREPLTIEIFEVAISYNKNSDSRIGALK